jgi:hypothetical protein
MRSKKRKENPVQEKECGKEGRRSGSREGGGSISMNKIRRRDGPNNKEERERLRAKRTGVR